jgi:2-methylisocitrate lyase-like PEP mutase family enzyme
LVGNFFSNFRRRALAEAGAKRISTGGALARAAINALLRAGTEMLERGSFEWTSELASSADVKKLLSVRIT